VLVRFETMRPVQRVTPFILALFVFPVVALAAAAGPHDETKRLNPADVTRAKRAAVRKADLLAGWRLMRSGPVEEDDTPCGFDPDLSAFVITGEHERDFEHGTTAAQITSVVDVFRNVGDSVNDFRAQAKPGLLSCFKSQMRRALREAKLPGKITTARMSTSPRIGAQSVSSRIVATVTSKPSFRIYMDFLAFRQGRYQGVLFFTAPFTPVQGQRALARSVARRMR
jgi:hypothetical protein